MFVVAIDDFIVLQVKRAVNELRLKNPVVRLQSAAKAIQEIKRRLVLKSPDRPVVVILDLSLSDIHRLLAWGEANPKNCPAVIGLQNAFAPRVIEQLSHLGLAALLALLLKAEDVAVALSRIPYSHSLSLSSS